MKMNRQKINLAVVIIAILLLCQTASAQQVTIDQAETVARNWITTVINIKGHWSDSPTAKMAEITELKRGDRVLGYFCRIEPSGHIIVSLIEGLAPIKAFSETSYLDPTSDEGPADLLKFQLERRLDVIEKELGPISTLKSADLDPLLELNHRAVWEKLLTGPLSFPDKYNPDEPSDNYVEGQVLLTSRWHQYAPYNILCPPPPAEADCDKPNCAVGCTATAGAQIMRYWSWPTGRPWLNMPDAMVVNPTSAEITAVSELCAMIGIGVSMQYCGYNTCASGAFTEDMADFLDGIQYNPLSPIVWRYQYEWYQWYDMIKANMNQNRPIQYEIKNHVIVCDGWWDTDMPMYHMNYGWGDGCNDWYTLDDLYQPDPEGSPAYELMLHEIYPICALGPTVTGTIPPNPGYPHRYVDRDCSAGSAYFTAGQLIHFLPYMRMTCTSGFLRFDGTPALNTRLYTAEYSRGIRIHDGSMVFYPDGAIKFRLQRPD